MRFALGFFRGSLIDFFPSSTLSNKISKAGLPGYKNRQNLMHFIAQDWTWIFIDNGRYPGSGDLSTEKEDDACCCPQYPSSVFSPCCWARLLVSPSNQTHKCCDREWIQEWEFFFKKKNSCRNNGSFWERKLLTLGALALLCWSRYNILHTEWPYLTGIFSRRKKKKESYVFNVILWIWFYPVFCSFTLSSCH